MVLLISVVPFVELFWETFWLFGGTLLVLVFGLLFVLFVVVDGLFCVVFAFVLIVDWLLKLGFAIPDFWGSFDGIVEAGCYGSTFDFWGTWLLVESFFTGGCWLEAGTSGV